jgi:hypothetical protein
MTKIIRLGPTSDDVTYYIPVELPDVFALYHNKSTLYCIKYDTNTHRIPEYLCNLKTVFINNPLDQSWGWYSDSNFAPKIYSTTNVPNNCRCRLRFDSIDTMYQNITTLVETYKERYPHVGI